MEKKAAKLRQAWESYVDILGFLDFDPAFLSARPLTRREIRARGITLDFENGCCRLDNRNCDLVNTLHKLFPALCERMVMCNLIVFVLEAAWLVFGWGLRTGLGMDGC